MRKKHKPWPGSAFSSLVAATRHALHANEEFVLSSGNTGQVESIINVAIEVNYLVVPRAQTHFSN